MGSTAINPGESTAIRFRFTMHDGMGGPHYFVMTLRTNDPVEPVKEFHILADFPPNSRNARAHGH